MTNKMRRRLRQESNPQPTDPKSGALSIELLRRDVDYSIRCEIRQAGYPTCEGFRGILPN